MLRCASQATVGTLRGQPHFYAPFLYEDHAVDGVPRLDIRSGSWFRCRSLNEGDLLIEHGVAPLEARALLCAEDHASNPLRVC